MEVIGKPIPEVKNLSKRGKYQQIVEWLKSGKMDVGFIEGIVNDSEIIKEVVGVDELVVVTADRSLDRDDLFIDSIQDRKWVF